MRRSPYFFPTLIGGAVWLAGSVWRAYEFGRRVRLPGPGSASITPFLDSFTQTLQAWLAPAFLIWAAVFVFERVLDERRDARTLRTSRDPAATTSSPPEA